MCSGAHRCVWSCCQTKKARTWVRPQLCQLSLHAAAISDAEKADSVQRQLTASASGAATGSACCGSAKALASRQWRRRHGHRVVLAHQPLQLQAWRQGGVSCRCRCRCCCAAGALCAAGSRGLSLPEPHQHPVRGVVRAPPFRRNARCRNPCRSRPAPCAGSHIKSEIKLSRACTATNSPGEASSSTSGRQVGREAGRWRVVGWAGWAGWAPACFHRHQHTVHTCQNDHDGAALPPGGWTPGWQGPRCRTGTPPRAIHGRLVAPRFSAVLAAGIPHRAMRRPALGTPVARLCERPPATTALYNRAVGTDQTIKRKNWS